MKKKIWGGGVWSFGGCLVLGVSGPGGSALGEAWHPCTEADTPSVDRITDACKNITLAQLRCGR